MASKPTADKTIAAIDDWTFPILAVACSHRPGLARNR
jgi:hypothetical protein